MSASDCRSTRTDVDNTLIDPAIDLVTFDELATSFDTEKDIFVIYQLGKKFVPTSRDWVGLYHAEWTDPTEYITFQWAPSVIPDGRESRRRGLLFQAKDICVAPSSSIQYCFLYVSGPDHVVGVSNSFTISSPPQLPTDGMGLNLSEVECLEYPLDDFGSFSFIETESKPTKDSGDSFEIVSGFFDLGNDNISSNEPQEGDPLSDYEQFDLSIFDGILSVGEESDDEEMVKVPKAYGQNTEMALVPYVGIQPLIEVNTEVPIFSLNKKSCTEDLLTPVSTKWLDSPKELRELALQQIVRECVMNLSPEYIMPPASFPIMIDRSALPQNEALFKQNQCSQSTESQQSQGSHKNRRCQLRRLKQRYADVKDQLDNVQNDLKLTEDILELKTFLLEDLVKDVKNMAHDNDTLEAANSKLRTTNAQLQKNLQAEQKEAASGRKSAVLADSLAKTGERREAEIKHITWLRDTLRSENDQLRHQKEVLSADLCDLQQRYKDLKSYQDDLLHTLAVKGTVKASDSNGNDISVDVLEGQVLDLEGWTTVKSKKTERHLAIIAAHERTIDELQAHVDKLKDDLEEERNAREDLSKKLGDRQLQVEQLKSTLTVEQAANGALLESVAVLESTVSQLRETELSLTTLLLDEQERSSQQQEDAAKKEQELQREIRHLHEKLLATERAIPRKIEKSEVCSQTTSPKKTSQQTQVEKTPSCGSGAHGACSSKPQTSVDMDDGAIKTVHYANTTGNSSKRVNSNTYDGARPYDFTPDVSASSVSSSQPTEVVVENDLSSSARLLNAIRVTAASLTPVPSYNITTVNECKQGKNNTNTRRNNENAHVNNRCYPMVSLHPGSAKQDSEKIQNVSGNALLDAMSCSKGPSTHHPQEMFESSDANEESSMSRVRSRCQEIFAPCLNSSVAREATAIKEGLKKFVSTSWADQMNDNSDPEESISSLWDEEAAKLEDKFFDAQHKNKRAFTKPRKFHCQRRNPPDNCSHYQGTGKPAAHIIQQPASKSYVYNPRFPKSHEK